MHKFNQWRANDHNRRATLDRSDRSSDRRYNDNDDEHENYDRENHSTTFQSAQNRNPTTESSELDDEMTTVGVGGSRNSFCSNQTSDFFEPMQSSQQLPIYGGKIPRHSLPANMNKQKSRRSKKSQLDPSTIHEGEVKEFEASHCYENLASNSNRTPFNSPPARFYKQNSDPYAAPTTSQTQSSTQILSQRACPEKPKRIMLKQQNTNQLTKELSGAHFSGAYKNYEIHSPFYATESDRLSERPRVSIGIRAAALPSSSSNYTGDESASTLLRHRASGHYQVVLNKDGEEVEYALPLVERQHSTGDQFRSVLGDNPNYDDEIFVEDPRECEQIVGRMFDDSGK